MASAWGASWGAAWGNAWGLLEGGFIHAPAGDGPPLRPAGGERVLSVSGARPGIEPTRRVAPVIGQRPAGLETGRPQDAAGQRSLSESAARPALSSTTRPAVTGGRRPLH